MPDTLVVQDLQGAPRNKQNSQSVELHYQWSILEQKAQQWHADVLMNTVRAPLVGGCDPLY